MAVAVGALFEAWLIGCGALGWILVEVCTVVLSNKLGPTKSRCAVSVNHTR